MSLLFSVCPEQMPINSFRYDRFLNLNGLLYDIFTLFQNPILLIFRFALSLYFFYFCKLFFRVKEERFERIIT